jgi:peptide/nickel transport system permease protein
MYSDGHRVARSVLGPQATEAEVAARAEQLGLNEPLVVQFWHWATGAIHGDFGRSIYNNQPGADALASRIPVTLSIVVGALVVTVLLGFSLGLISAYRGGWLDRGLQMLAVTGFAVPHFLFAIALVAVFALSLRVLPATGYVLPSQSLTGWLASITLPIVALASGTVAAASQQIRGAVRDVMSQDYMRTLRSRGVGTFWLYVRHGLKNAGTPGLTTVSLQFIAMLGGAVVVERVFALQGLGTLVTDSALRSDVPVIMGAVVFTVVVVVLVNLTVDLLVAWINPKVRLS